MEDRSLAREVALLVLGQISDNKIEDYESFSLEKILSMGLDTLLTHSREQLDDCASQIEIAQEKLLNLELQEFNKKSFESISHHFTLTLSQSQNIVNVLSDTLELPKHKLWDNAIIKVREANLLKIPHILSLISEDKFAE